MESQEQITSPDQGPRYFYIDKPTINLMPQVGLEAQKLNAASKKKLEYGKSLEKDQIRLLHLHPGSDRDPVICSLFLNYVEGNTTPFEAVSYVWGSENNPRFITCNWVIPFVDHEGLGYALPIEITSNMPVTENLYRFLLRSRHPEAIRTLWIDQICIDQDDNPEKLEEKMVQVRMMAEVYSAAHNVLLWLGEEDSETATAFGMMKWMAATINMSEQEIGTLISYLKFTDDFSNGESKDPVEYKRTMEYVKSLLIHVEPAYIAGIKDLTSPNKVQMALFGGRAFDSLLKRTWFTRSWTFQEVITAMSATIMCGSHEVEWDILYQACKSSQAHRVKRGEHHERMNKAFITESIIKRGELQQHWAKLKRIASGSMPTSSPHDMTWLSLGVFHEQRKIKRLLPLLRPTSCKNPRDKVLALLGISHDDNRRIIFPTYKLPVVNLYTSIVLYWISEPGKMDISFLNHIQKSNPEHKLPSWVPDWSLPVIATPLIEVAEFSASGDMAPEVFMDKVDYFSNFKPFPYFPPLILEGFLILKVEDVADITKHERHAEMMSKFENPYPTTGLSYLEAYQKTVYPNIPEDFGPLQKLNGAPNFWEYNNNYEVNRNPAVLPASQQRYTARDLESSVPYGSNPFDMQSQYHTRSPTPGRAFFVSTTGFIGLCPKSTIPGDRIYILLGGATPFVIRVPEDNMVRFVGECFVPGAMHGETLEGRPGKRQMVILR